MYRIEINIYEKELCIKLVIFKDCNEMHGQHGQQNIKSSREENVVYMFYGAVSCCVHTPASGNANKILFVNNINNGNELKEI